MEGFDGVWFQGSRCNHSVLAFLGEALNSIKLWQNFPQRMVLSLSFSSTVDPDLTILMLSCRSMHPAMRFLDSWGTYSAFSKIILWSLWPLMMARPMPSDSDSLKPHSHPHLGYPASFPWPGTPLSWKLPAFLLTKVKLTPRRWGQKLWWVSSKYVQHGNYSDLHRKRETGLK